MTDLLERLAEADPVRADELAPRLEDVWRRTETAEPRRFLPARGGALRRRPARWATLGVATAVAVAAVLVLGTSGHGLQNAFAGWSATPTTPAGGQLAAAQAACQQQDPQLRSATPTVADTRGPSSLLLYADGASETACVTGPPLLGTFTDSPTVDGAALAAAAIDPQAILVGLAADGQGFRVLAGRVGDGVTAMSLVLAGGSTVQASVAGGWFAAWWPGSWSGSAGAPPSDQALAGFDQSAVQSVEITTASGTTTQPLDYGDIQPPSGGVPQGAGGASNG